MLEVFGNGAVLNEFRDSSLGRDKRVIALLLAEPSEKNILGVDLVDGQLRHDVAQLRLTFTVIVWWSPQRMKRIRAVS